MPNDPLGWSNSRRQSPYNERFYFLHQRFVEVHFLAVGLVVALHTVPTFRSVRNKLFLVVNLTEYHYAILLSNDKYRLESELARLPFFIS